MTFINAFAQTCGAVPIPAPRFYVDDMVLEIFVRFGNGRLVLELLHGLPTIF